MKHFKCIQELLLVKLTTTRLANEFILTKICLGLEEKDAQEKESQENKEVENLDEPVEEELADINNLIV
jgi:hypothetical protein